MPSKHTVRERQSICFLPLPLQEARVCWAVLLPHFQLSKPKPKPPTTPLQLRILCPHHQHLELLINLLPFPFNSNQWLGVNAAYIMPCNTKNTAVSESAVLQWPERAFKYNSDHVDNPLFKTPQPLWNMEVLQKEKNRITIGSSHSWAYIQTNL